MGTQAVVSHMFSPSGAAGLPTYEIALATCDGSRFLEEQLDSLAAQTLPPCRLVVVDDGSNDDTVARIRMWALRSSFSVLLLVRENRLGSLTSFAEALAATEAAYVFLCDQDDHWDPDKAEVLLRCMARLEEKHGRDVPLLVHGDLRLIDVSGTVINPSFHLLQNLDPSRDDLLDLALQNTVTGCATLVNRACLDAALPFPERAVLHDWWLALVAAGLGAVAYEPVPLVSYRQHGSNLVGAAGFRQQMFRRLRQLLGHWQLGNLVLPPIQQLQAYVESYGNRLGRSLSHDRALYVKRLTSNVRTERMAAALALRLRKHGWVRTLGFYFCLLLWQPSRR